MKQKGGGESDFVGRGLLNNGVWRKKERVRSNEGWWLGLARDKIIEDLKISV